MKHCAHFFHILSKPIIWHQDSKTDQRICTDFRRSHSEIRHGALRAMVSRLVLIRNREYNEESEGDMEIYAPNKGWGQLKL